MSKDFAEFPETPYLVGLSGLFLRVENDLGYYFFSPSHAFLSSVLKFGPRSLSLGIGLLSSRFCFCIPFLQTSLGGIGHMGRKKQTQMAFSSAHWRHRYSHGGSLRKRRLGRGARPLSSRDSIHLVLKANRLCLGSGLGLRTYKRFFLIQKLAQRYGWKFYVRIEQISIQADHIHLLVRGSRRSGLQNFLRVFAGQISQNFQKHELTLVTDTTKNLGQSETRQTKLWLQRPFTRVVKGWKGLQIVRAYIQLNEKEALGEISYQKRRLRGFSLTDWQELWS